MFDIKEIKSAQEYKNILKEELTKHMQSPNQYIDFVDNFVMSSVKGNLGNYNWKNRLAIATQDPNAQLIKTYGGWRKLGVSVNKGEKAIYIQTIVPLCKGEHKTNPKECSETCKDRYAKFRNMAMFDVKQTSLYDEYLKKNNKWDDSINFSKYEELLKFLQTKTNTDFEYEETVGKGKVEGWTDGRKINVAKNINNPLAKANVLLHEFGHLTLGHPSDGKGYVGHERGVKEVQAETFSFIGRNILMPQNIEELSNSDQAALNNQAAYISGWYKNTNEDYDIIADYDIVFNKIKEKIIDPLVKLNLIKTISDEEIVGMVEQINKNKEDEEEME